MGAPGLSSYYDYIFVPFLQKENVVSMLSYYCADKSASVPPDLFSSPLNKKEATFSLSGKRAVIVEDEGITQLQLTRMLRSKGIKIVGTAANGIDAIKVVLEEQPDFVLMDINMPLMNGLEASERILAQHQVCIVMLTAFSEEEYQERAKAMGTCGYVIKPVTSETLIPEIEAALSKFHAPQ